MKRQVILRKHYSKEEEEKVIEALKMRGTRESVAKQLSKELCRPYSMVLCKMRRVEKGGVNTRSYNNK